MNIQYDTPLTGLRGVREGGEGLLSFHMSFRLCADTLKRRKSDTANMKIVHILQLNGLKGTLCQVYTRTLDLGFNAPSSKLVHLTYFYYFNRLVTS